MKLLPLSHPFQCRNKVCGDCCLIANVACPDKWEFPPDCPLEDVENGWLNDYITARIEALNTMFVDYGCEDVDSRIDELQMILSAVKRENK